MATLPGEVGYLGSEIEQVDRPFSMSTGVINGELTISSAAPQHNLGLQEVVWVF
jgi:hypothetical protein